MNNAAEWRSAEGRCAAGPTFGERVPGRMYRRRPSVYAIVLDARHRVAVVRSAKGCVVLPGGGIEPGESPEAALAREVREECGCGFRNITRVCEATQHVDAGEEGCFAKHSTFYRGAFEHEPTATTVGVHELLWLRAVDAATAMSHESHGWAVDCTVRMIPEPTT